MRSLWVLLCALPLLCAGCGSQWDEFWKDLRGDNMQMRNDFSGPSAIGDRR